MFFNLHSQTKIGYKLLTEADLGTGTSHQTHIGLFENTLDFITNFHQQSFAQFIYNNSSKELLSFLDPIQNPDGTYRSPKIRSASESDLDISGTRVNSVVREIREIVRSEENNEWYLFWFGLENEDLVFFLIKKDSQNYIEILNIIGEINNRGVIEREATNFNQIIEFLNKKVNDLNIEYEEELEVVAQTGEITIEKRIRPKFYDIEKAKAIFKEIGKKGEKLVNDYLKKLKEENEINDFKWMNEKKESGMPYDFEITQNNGEVFFTDVKSTSYKFEQRMIFSGQEFKFINQNENYLIHRVFDLKESPKLKVCNNVKNVSDNFVPNLNSFTSKVSSNGLKINSVKVEVPPILDNLTFDNEVSLV